MLVKVPVGLINEVLGNLDPGDEAEVVYHGHPDNHYVVKMEGHVDHFSLPKEAEVIHPGNRKILEQVFKLMEG
tara:strand:- start:5632 stop:5850 length:219 start_codon:yes stop_codon:yes gene_type:complete